MTERYGRFQKNGIQFPATPIDEKRGAQYDPDGNMGTYNTRTHALVERMTKGLAVELYAGWRVSEIFEALGIIKTVGTYPLQASKGLK